MITAIDAASGVISAVGQAAQSMINAGSTLVITAIDAASGVISAVGQAAQSIIGAGATLVVTAIDAATGIVTSISQSVSGIVSQAKNFIISAIDNATRVVASISQGIDSIVSSAKNFVVGVVDSATKVATSVGDGISGIVSATKNFIVGAIDKATSVVTGVDSKVESTVSPPQNFSVGAIDNTTDVLKNIQKQINSVISGNYMVRIYTNAADAEAAVDSLISALDSIPTDITVTIHIEVDGEIPSFNAAGGIVGHATGGVIPHSVGGIFNKPTLTHIKGTSHIFGEAGREAVLPLDTYTGWMDEIAAKVDNRINKDNEAMTFEQALNNFFQSSLEPIMAHMDTNMQRQADKDEHPVVKIGNRDIKTAYDTQAKADGYSFRR